MHDVIRINRKQAPRGPKLVSNDVEICGNFGMVGFNGQGSLRLTGHSEK